MRFMYIVTSPQPSSRPTPELMEAMGKLADREIKAGRMLDNGGLMPVADGRAGAHHRRQAQRRRRPVRGDQGGDRRLRDLRTAGQGRGRGGGESSSCSSTSDHMPGWEGTCEVRAFATPAWTGLPGRCARHADASGAMSAAMTAADAHRTILAVWRIEQPRLITSLSRMLRDVPLAEDLTQEALLAALEHWPATGVPEKPGALADGDRQAPGARIICAAARCSRASTRWSRGTWSRSSRPCPIWTPRWTTTSATNCCG